MRNTQPVPTCPQCGARVYRTHTCRVSGLRLGLNGKLPERGEQLPAARPLQLVPMPEGWRDQVHDELEAHWPARAQLELVTELDLDWRDADPDDMFSPPVDGPEAGHVSVSAVLTTLALAIGTAAVVLVDRLVTL